MTNSQGTSYFQEKLIPKGPQFPRDLLFLGKTNSQGTSIPGNPAVARQTWLFLFKYITHRSWNRGKSRKSPVCIFKIWRGKHYPNSNWSTPKESQWLLLSRGIFNFYDILIFGVFFDSLSYPNLSDFCFFGQIWGSQVFIFVIWRGKHYSYSNWSTPKESQWLLLSRGIFILYDILMFGVFFNSLSYPNLSDFCFLVKFEKVKFLFLWFEGVNITQIPIGVHHKNHNDFYFHGVSLFFTISWCLGYFLIV